MRLVLQNLHRMYCHLGTSLNLFVITSRARDPVSVSSFNPSSTSSRPWTWLKELCRTVKYALLHTKRYQIFSAHPSHTTLVIESHNTYPLTLPRPHYIKVIRLSKLSSFSLRWSVTRKAVSLGSSTSDSYFEQFWKLSSGTISRSISHFECYI